MNMKNRYIIYALPFLLMGLTPPPAPAGPFLQCPNPLLTRGGPGQNAFDPVHPNDPLRSTDPACRAAFTAMQQAFQTAAATLPPSAVTGAQMDALALFRNTCLVDIDPVTGQPSGKTVTTTPPFDPASQPSDPALPHLVAPPGSASTGVVDPVILCRSLAAGDGHISMADRAITDQTDIGYIFGFQEMTGVPADFIAALGMLADNTGTPLAGFSNSGANFSAPTLFTREGTNLYLTLTNVGMVERPDLPDPHTVHYHGFTNAASIFDGEPMASVGTNMFDSLTYYYENVDPGTYMFHCHVEASEHMQMGMLGNLYVNPAQDGTTINGFTQFAYNDCTTFPIVTGAGADPMCGFTGYNTPYFLQVTAFDPNFHHDDHTYNPLNFADMSDTYGLLNGRGYPDTVDPNPILNIYSNASQPIPAIPMTLVGGVRTPVTIPSGQKVLLRLSSLATVDFYTITSLGIPMQVVGQGARILRGPSTDGGVTPGLSTVYNTNSVTFGGGEAYDILLNTAGVTPGTYFIYAANLNNLANNTEDFGGMMTEIVVQ
jgi:FtsP/CotA-like multicopper oxidase with cupredoxin domain